MTPELIAMNPELDLVGLSDYFSYPIACIPPHQVHPTATRGPIAITPEIYPAKFIAGDAFDDGHIRPTAPILSIPPPSLASVNTLMELRGCSSSLPYTYSIPPGWSVANVSSVPLSLPSSKVAQDPFPSNLVSPALEYPSYFQNVFETASPFLPSICRSSLTMPDARSIQNASPYHSAVSALSGVYFQTIEIPATSDGRDLDLHAEGVAAEEPWLTGDLDLSSTIFTTYPVRFA